MQFHMLIFWEGHSCHFHNKPLTFWGSPSFLTALSPGIDNVFLAIAGEKLGFLLRYLLACCSWSLCVFEFFGFCLFACLLLLLFF